MKFTASPPRLVSLYFDCMSAPVWRMVATTLSSETRWRPSPCSASDAAAIALTAPKALRSMHGDLHQAADRIAGHASTAVARSVSMVTARRPPRPNALSRTPS
jgi:hypothetical protein